MNLYEIGGFYTYNIQYNMYLNKCWLKHQNIFCSTSQTQMDWTTTNHLYWGS